MKLNGTYKFKAHITQVFNAILNPEVLKNCIPGCDSVEYVDPNNIRANITVPLPGFKGPFGVVVNIAKREDPKYLELHLNRSGKGGTVNAVSQITLTDEPDGTLLTYNANATLGGAIAIANNPIVEGTVKTSLGSFFKNLDRTIS